MLPRDDLLFMAKHSDFQKLWDVLMIRVISEAICETAGSMMNQHCGKNRFLQPEIFNIEICLKSNLFPPSDEFCNFCDAAGSVLDSQHYIHP